MPWFMGMLAYAFDVLDGSSGACPFSFELIKEGGGVSSSLSQLESVVCRKETETARERGFARKRVIV